MDILDSGVSPFRRNNPAWFFIRSFIFVILTGALLLMLPMSSKSGSFTDPLTALFTATSATCVTGLVVVDTGTYWSSFGHLVIMGLIQIGGLSYIVLVTSLMVLLNRKIPLRERIMIQFSLNTLSIKGIIGFLKGILLTVLIFEGIGALSLFTIFIRNHSFIEALKFAIFHSVSAFCNAGFDLIGGFRSFTQYVDNIQLNLTVTLLIITGGIGFFVIYDIYQKITKRKNHLSIHSKAALLTTLFLIIFGTIMIFILEYNNTLKPLSWTGKILGSYFQSVTPRTAGFNTIDIGKMRPATWLLLIILMFIGASPGGTGGGIKTVTFLVISLSIFAILLERKHVHFKNRSLNWETVKRAWAVFFFSLFLVLFSWFLLLLTEPFEPLKLLFEVVSAFGTVGLSTGITPQLSSFGRIIIILTMFLGRVGTVTAGLALLSSINHKKLIDYPVEEVSVG